MMHSYIAKFGKEVKNKKYQIMDWSDWYKKQ